MMPSVTIACLVGGCYGVGFTDGLGITDGYSPDDFRECACRGSGFMLSSLFSCLVRGFWVVEFTDPHSCLDCLVCGFSVGSVMPAAALPACRWGFLPFFLLLWGGVYRCIAIPCLWDLHRAKSAPKGIRAYSILPFPPAVLPAAMGWGLLMPAAALPACLGVCFVCCCLLWGGVC